MWAQTDTGLVSGFILDSSGAAIPGANVKMTDPATGRSFDAKTAPSGSYSVPAVPAGTYSLTASAAGFASQVQKGVVVDVGSKVEANFTLRPGTVTETVEVQGGTPLLEAENSSVGQVMPNHNIEELPLNGRTYSQLAELAPGAVHNYASRATDAFALNGARSFQNEFLVDGMDNNSYILGADSASTQAIHPSVDAIAEFRVESANYSAEYGRAQGGIITVAIKSGTNAFHGSAFEYLRNDDTDANNFFSNKAGLARPPLKQNQFGGTVGGPVIKNRLFFFTSYQGTLTNSTTTFTSSVPTPAEVLGNFGNIAVFDPHTANAAGSRQEFPNNIIPASRFDSVGTALAKLYPVPNLRGLVNNFSANALNLNHDQEGDARIDYQLTSKDSIFVRGSGDGRTIEQGPEFASPGNGGNNFNQYPLSQPIQSYSVIGNWTRTISAHLVNEFRSGFTRLDSNQLPLESTPLDSQFGITGVPAVAGLNGLPQIALGGFADLGSRTFEPNLKQTGVFQLIDDLTWVHGAHIVKVGFDYHRNSNNAATSSSARGSYNFNGQFTSATAGVGSGSSVADLLLGQPNTATLSTEQTGDLRDDYYGAFINDTWKLTRKLTLNLGLRYEIQTPLWEDHNQQGDFDLNPQSTGYGTVLPAQPGSIQSRAFAGVQINNWAPRMGFAYQLAPKTVVRAAAGLFYGGLGYQAIAQLGPANEPFFLSVSFPSASAAATSLVPLSGGFPAGAVSLANIKNPAAVAIPSNFPLPLTYQWNFSIERELGYATVLTVTYVGSSTEHLPGFADANDPVPGPGAIQARRPFPTFGMITLNAPFAHASYESLQSKVERRYASGVALLASYTYSHAIDNSVNGEDTNGGPTTPQNPRDTNAEKGSSDIDVRNRFIASGTWELPVGRRDRFLGSNAVSRAVLGGWQIGGILTAQSGFALTPTVSTNPANTESTGRPNRVCSGKLSDPTVQMWYQVTCFPSAAPFTFGDASRGSIEGPGLVSLDAFLSRNFRIGEKRALIFRWEAYNSLNHANFSAPVLTTDTASAGSITSTVIPNREMQFALRLTF
jgi:hypothetical protein